MEDHIPISKPGDDHDGSEGFLLSDVHVILHICEDCWLKEEACRGDSGLRHIEGIGPWLSPPYAGQGLALTVCLTLVLTGTL